ncbi:MAG: hypothetical protein LUP93_01995 [Methanomicrobiales archaeon]|jgi:hypothetical protein|nr:hypothetical protein [Methanomicrobiales archaeon]MDD1645076.1 hypothetical protein [Methanomicrobiales archaeon]MDD1646917.1 hypothetical protein [Methanomicrobiales archaeon]
MEVTDCVAAAVDSPNVAIITSSVLGKNGIYKFRNLAKIAISGMPPDQSRDNDSILLDPSTLIWEV